MYGRFQRNKERCTNDIHILIKIDKSYMRIIKGNIGLNSK